ncbi:hypothetical protein DFH06DRAFT_1292488 [Mycena polygramma]|nr:hypothetical protein DFH06DRAFT_1292488 [Mycena polygramma]
MAALDPILGALLLGTWFSSILFGIVLVEAYKYFSTFPDDSWFRKGLVILLLTLCCLALVGEYGTTYLPAVTYWGDVQGLTTVFWTFPVAYFGNGIAGTIVDFYLIYRFYSLSKNIWITLIFSAMNLLALAGFLIVMVLLPKRSRTDHPTLTIGAIMNFIATSVVDVLIALGLIWKLRGMKSNFAQTNTFLKRVMVGAIRTGSITALCSILDLATFLNNPQTDVSTAFSYQFAQLYTLTLLFNFNLRRTAGMLSGTSKTSESRNGNTNTMRMDGIQVHRTLHVQMDPISSVGDATTRRLDELEDVKHHSSDVESLSARNLDISPMKS